MASQTNRWKLGLFVAVGFAAAIGSVVWLSTRAGHESVTGYCFFDQSVAGLDIGSPVKYRGIPIGTVSDIRAAPHLDWVKVELEFYRDTLIELGFVRPDGDVAVEVQRVVGGRAVRARIQSSLLTGVAYIAADIYDAEQHKAPDYPFEVPEFTVHSVPSTDIIVRDKLEDALEAIPPAAKAAEGMFKEIEQGVKDLRVKELSAKAEKLIDDIDRAVLKIDQAVVDLDMKKTSGNLNDTLLEVKGTFEHATEAIDKWKDPEGPIDQLLVSLRKEVEGMELELTAEKARNMMDKVAGAAGPIGPAAKEVELLFADLRKELRYLRSALQSVERLVNMLEKDPGSAIHGRSPVESPQAKGK